MAQVSDKLGLVLTENHRHGVRYDPLPVPIMSIDQSIFNSEGVSIWSWYTILLYEIKEFSVDLHRIRIRNGAGQRPLHQCKSVVYSVPLYQCFANVAMNKRKEDFDGGYTWLDILWGPCPFGVTRTWYLPNWSGLKQRGAFLINVWPDPKLSFTWLFESTRNKVELGMENTYSPPKHSQMPS